MSSFSVPGFPSRRVAASSFRAGALALIAVGISAACAADPNGALVTDPLMTMGGAGSGGFGAAGVPTAMGGAAGMAAAGMAAAGATGMAGGTAVSFAAQLEHFFEENCVEGCHTTGSFGGPNGQSVDANLSLVPGESYAALVGVASTQVPTMALIGPTAAESYLWHKVSGTHLDVGGRGLRMPFGAAIREPASLQLIFDWIEGGAQP